MRSIKIAACISSTIWKNKYLEIEVKARIYNVAVILIMTYTPEIQPDISNTKRMLKMEEMKVMR